MDKQKIFYSIDETATLIGLGKTKIYAEIKSGALTAQKCGKRTLVSADAIRNWQDTLPFAGGKL